MQRTVKAFRIIKALVAEKFPRACGIKLFIGCPIAELDRERSSRQFAHALHFKNKDIICISHRMEELPKKYLFGIFLHEFGHVLGSPKEEGADLFIFRHFGIVINYAGKRELQEV